MPIQLPSFFPVMAIISSDRTAFSGNIGFSKRMGNPNFSNVSQCLENIDFVGEMVLIANFVSSFLSCLPLSVAATFLPDISNNVLTTFERNTLCKSATASIFSFRKSENKRNNPANPLCLSFKSIPKNVTFSMSSKKGLKKGRETTVILTSGYCKEKAFSTGTVIATSPIAESLITKMCFDIYFLF